METDCKNCQKSQMKSLIIITICGFIYVQNQNYVFKILLITQWETLNLMGDFDKIFQKTSNSFISKFIPKLQ